MQTLMLFVALAAPQWVRVKDAYRAHERYVVRETDGSQLMLGEYFEVAPGDFRASCSGKEPEGFATEAAAQQYVLGCEVWR